MPQICSNLPKSAPPPRARVERLEDFDEFEEWHLKCAHYVVVRAGNKFHPDVDKDDDVTETYLDLEDEIVHPDVQEGDDVTETRPDGEEDDADAGRRVSGVGYLDRQTNGHTDRQTDIHKNIHTGRY